MSLQNSELLAANVTFLTAEGVTVIEPTGAQEIASILDDATVQISIIPGTVIQVLSMRKQWLVNVGGNRLVVADQSGASDPRPQLATLAARFADLFFPDISPRFRDYGYNFEVAFDTSGGEPAREVIRDKLLKPDLLSNVENAFVKGATSVRVLFDWDGAGCQLVIEPRGGTEATRLYATINFNYSIGGAALPSQDEMKADIERRWASYLELLDRMVA